MKKDTSSNSQLGSGVVVISDMGDGLSANKLLLALRLLLILSYGGGESGGRKSSVKDEGEVGVGGARRGRESELAGDHFGVGGRPGEGGIFGRGLLGEFNTNGSGSFRDNKGLVFSVSNSFSNTLVVD